jgi:hypothetical protein
VRHGSKTCVSYNVPIDNANNDVSKRKLVQDVVDVTVCSCLGDVRGVVINSGRSQLSRGCQSTIVYARLVRVRLRSERTAIVKM